MEVERIDTEITLPSDYSWVDLKTRFITEEDSNNTDRMFKNYALAQPGRLLAGKTYKVSLVPISYGLATCPASVSYGLSAVYCGAEGLIVLYKFAKKEILQDATTGGLFSLERHSYPFDGSNSYDQEYVPFMCSYLHGRTLFYCEKRTCGLDFTNAFIVFEEKKG